MLGSKSLKVAVRGLLRAPTRLSFLLLPRFYVLYLQDNQNLLPRLLAEPLEMEVFMSQLLKTVTASSVSAKWSTRARQLASVCSPTHTNTIFPFNFSHIKRGFSP